MAFKNDKISTELEVRTQRAEAEIHRCSKAIDEFRKQNVAYRKELAALATAEGDTREKAAQLKAAIDENNRSIDAHKRAIEKARESIDISRMSAADLKKELKRLSTQLAHTSKNAHPEEYHKLEKQIERTKTALAEATKSTLGFFESLRNLDKFKAVIMGFFTALGMRILNDVVNSFRQAITVIQDFERANSKLASVLGTSAQGISALTEQAKFLGRTTTATASEVTGLQTELAKLGFSQDVIEKLTPATLRFARAVDTDLSSAAAFAGAAMRMFNKDADQAEDVMASFAVATTSSALDFHKLEASLATVGPVANAFGFTVEETTALLGALSNAGFDASSAATATRNILLNLADSSGDLAQALGGPVKNLDDMVTGLNKLNAEGVDLAKALELTDKRSVAAFATFLNGSNSILALRDSITDCTGDFREMYETMTDNAAGSWAGLQSALEGLILKFFDFKDVLRTLYDWGTSVVTWLGEIVDAFSAFGTVVGWVAKAVGVLVVGVGTVVGWLSRLFTQTSVGRAVLNGLVTAFISLKAVMLLTSKATRGYVSDLGYLCKSIWGSITALAAKAKALILDAASNVKAAIATRTFNAALMANPIMLVVGLIATIVSVIIGYNSVASEAADKTNAWAEANREAAKQYGEQKGKIEALVMVAENENISLERRKKAVAELNRIIPGYNAQIDTTTGKYKASKKALDEYLASMEKEMRYKANEAKLQELVTKAEEARDAYDQAEIAAASERRKKIDRNRLTADDRREKSKLAKKRRKEYADAEQELSDFKARMTKAIEEGVIVPPAATESVDAVTDSLSNTNKTSAETVSRLKEINAELKRLRKIDPQSDEELDRIQKRIKLLKEEKKELEGKNKAKHTPGTYREDSLDEVTAPVDDAHQRRLLEINKADMTAAERTIAKNRELLRYNGELFAALEKLREATASTHTKTLDKITEEENKLAQSSVKARQEIDKALASQDSESHKQRQQANEAFYKHQTDLLRAQVMAEPQLKEAANVYQLDLDRQYHADQLRELKEYYDRVSAADHYSTEEKNNRLQSISKEMKAVQSQILTDAGKLSEVIREASTDTTSIEGVKAGFDRQREAMTAYYESLKSMEGISAEDTVALEEEKHRRIAALNFQYQEQMWQLQELTGLSWADEYNRELAQLDNYHTQGLIKERDYQKKKLRLGVDNAKKYFDYYSQLSGSMFSAIQDAEIAQSDAKYDVLIQQAKNNGEDTAALEEEKENKKLEIQKRYADVNFAIKVSQIVADTAVAVMKAFADLGPIAGAVAAALVTATGAAQVISAKAERDKIKNLQPSRTAKSSTSTTAPATAERVLSGYSDGGYTGEGDRYEVAGVVHRGEYVVPKPIMNNPRVVDAVGMIEAIRRNHIPGTGNMVPATTRSYADGGYTAPTQSTAESANLASAITELNTRLKDLRAYVVLSDFDDARSRQDRARRPFTRNSN